MEIKSLNHDRSCIIHELKVQLLQDNKMTSDIWNALFTEEQYLYQLITVIHHD